jgi:hypothetical protein
MASDLTKAIAIYPMVEEHEATGRVAAVYSHILRSMPFVPSLFKSLAVCPAYLVLAWDQTVHAMSEDALADAAAELASTAAGAGQPPAQVEVRDTVSQFVVPLSRMLLLSMGLLHALNGEVAGTSASPETPSAGGVTERQVPSQWDTPQAWETFGDIRAVLQTPIVNTIWRVLAERGLLDAAWAELRPRVAATRDDAQALQQLACDRARSLHWPVVADAIALDAAGVADALPGMTGVLDAYVKTLPRVLVLAGPAAVAVRRNARPHAS